MTISPVISTLPSRVRDEATADWVVAYIQARYRAALHQSLLEEIEKSGLSQTQIAKRAKMGADQLSRILGFPRNIEADTYARLFYAIADKEPAVAAAKPSAAVAAQPLLKRSEETNLGVALWPMINPAAQGNLDNSPKSILRLISYQSDGQMGSDMSTPIMYGYDHPNSTSPSRSPS
jgi:hypothetical protein